MWQAAVTSIGRTTDLAIIDVSRYSSSIEWEVNFLTDTKPTRSLVIAAEQSLNVPSQCDFAGPVEEYAVSPASDSAFERRVRERLEAML